MRKSTILIAALAVTSPAIAQDFSPPLAGPYYNTGGNETAYSFAAGGTAKRTGDTAAMTRVVMFVTARDIEGVQVGRLDTVMEYQCEKAQMRPTLIAARGLDNAVLKLIPRPGEEWESIPASNASAAYELELACNGIAPKDRPAFPNIDDRIKRFRDSGQ
ncbi:hypothetical protein TPR58_19220 [Sphingomonas sp. HF-S3]|uniref:Uncharacterized protein n=1 Tax=Sphingomonas rustica TaxID=3103142 RepID=A0ABV0BCN8_9SPHN